MPKTDPSKIDLSPTLNRRQLLRDLSIAALATQVTQASFARGLLEQTPSLETVAEAKFADVLKLSDQSWAVVSKPLTGGFETLCNGGFSAGSERVVLFEAFGSSEGISWVLDACSQATKRTPTDVVVSHHHGDHIGGLASLAELGEPPQLWTTESIRATLPEELKSWTKGANILKPGYNHTIDMGGSSLELRPMSGHTASDLVAIVDGRIAYCGDVLWNDLFPNFVDASPLTLRTTVDQLIEPQYEVYVPGHGGLPSHEAVSHYSSMLDAVEEAARKSHSSGTAPKQAAAGFALPESLGTWRLFGADFFERAFVAWHRELGDA